MKCGRYQVLYYRITVNGKRVWTPMKGIKYCPGCGDAAKEGGKMYHNGPRLTGQTAAPSKGRTRFKGRMG